MTQIERSATLAFLLTTATCRSGHGWNYSDKHETAGSSEFHSGKRCEIAEQKTNLNPSDFHSRKRPSCTVEENGQILWQK